MCARRSRDYSGIDRSVGASMRRGKKTARGARSRTSAAAAVPVRANAARKAVVRRRSRVIVNKFCGFPPGRGRAAGNPTPPPSPPTGLRQPPVPKLIFFFPFLFFFRFQLLLAHVHRVQILYCRGDDAESINN